MSNHAMRWPAGDFTGKPCGDLGLVPRSCMQGVNGWSSKKADKENYGVFVPENKHRCFSWEMKTIYKILWLLVEFIYLPLVIVFISALLKGFFDIDIYFSAFVLLFVYVIIVIFVHRRGGGRRRGQNRGH